MARTQNDVSAGVVKLDLRAARSTAIIAVSELRWKIHEDCRVLDNKTPDDVSWSGAARRIARHADALQVAAETAHALELAEKRREIKLVNRERITLYRTEDGTPLCPVCGGPLEIYARESWTGVSFSVEEDDKLDFAVDDGDFKGTEITLIRCKQSGALHLWITDPNERYITWKTVKGVCCPHCGSTRVRKSGGSDGYCYDCNHYFDWVFDPEAE